MGCVLNMNVVRSVDLRRNTITLRRRTSAAVSRSKVGLGSDSRRAPSHGATAEVTVKLSETTDSRPRLPITSKSDLVVRHAVCAAYGEPITLSVMSNDAPLWKLAYYRRDVIQMPYNLWQKRRLLPEHAKTVDFLFILLHESISLTDVTFWTLTLSKGVTMSQIVTRSTAGLVDTVIVVITVYSGSFASSSSPSVSSTDLHESRNSGCGRRHAMRHANNDLIS